MTTSGMNFSYQTINDPSSSSLTEILSINNLGKIAGFYGVPSSGFTARPSYKTTQFDKANYPGAVATEVTSINNQKTIAGWYLTTKGQTYGFTKVAGIWTSYQDPHSRGVAAQITAILGLADDGIAVGYYEDSASLDHAFEIDTTIASFQPISVPGAISAAATGINGKGDIVGWLTTSSGTTEGWLLKGGIFTDFAYPGALSTMPTSVNWTDNVVGSYLDAFGATHGFLLTNPLNTQSWQQIDEPNAYAGAETVITGVNNHHSMVGYYKDATGNVNGFLATLVR